MKTRRLWVCAAGLLAGCGGLEKKAEPAIGPAPDSFRVVFDTNKGEFVIEVMKAWAPEGAERFWRLVKLGFFDGARFFRVVRNFVVQFGINGDPAVNARWRNMTVKDDPVQESNRRGTITFATSGPHSRTTQVFINLADNTRLDQQGFAPFGRVVSAMDVVDRLYSSYGDGPPLGNGPNQELIQTQGNAYLEREFPRLDYIRTVRVQ